MRFNKFDLNLLVALDALLKEQSVTRAAEQLHLSQPAMSNALSRLRTYFGDELLVQMGRQLELTPRAEALRDEVQDILLRISTSISTPPQFDCSKSDRTFKLFISDFSMTVLMPHVFALAAQQNSKVQFQLLPQNLSPAQLLTRGDADLLIIPQTYCSAEHPVESLFEDHFVCVVWKHSMHAQTLMSVERYTLSRHVVMQPLETADGTFDRDFLLSQGIQRKVGVSTYSFAAMPSLVVGTEYIATVMETLAKRSQPALPIDILPLPISTPPLMQAVQWHRHRSQDPGLIWLRQLLKEAANAALEEPVLV